MADMVCRKCGGRCSVLDGQRFDEERRSYHPAFKVVCMRCGDESGPVSGTKYGAIAAWKKQQQEAAGGADVG